MSPNSKNEFSEMIDPYTNNIHEQLAKYMLVDGFDIILDIEKSHGAYLVDKKTGDHYLDLFTFFASNPLGMNHPKMLRDSVKEELLLSAINKPSNSDVYTQQMAEFVEAFGTIAKPEYMKYLFFVSGGALAVENGLKVAFDWKVQKNFAKGYNEEKGHKVIHFKQAFHGRSGYTLSLTNTDINKVKYFPKFDWPRVSNPKVIFPLENNLETVIASEKKALDEIMTAIKNNPDDIAVIIIEPIQGEGGDNFFRPEFLQKLRDIADENDILLMYDEVQTGFGMTGKFWAADHYVKPDIMSFGKKAQICGIMASDRIDDIEQNCFRKSSRINSTWGGSLTDMVRSKHILNIIKEDHLVDNAFLMGAYLLENLYNIQNLFPNLISNVRGLGLMCAFDLPSGSLRDEFRELCYKEKMIILGCGEKSIRFRPALTVEQSTIDKAVEIIKNALYLLSSKN